MARPREFDPNEALQTAIDLFWERGYYDSSVDEIVKRSGVAKYGIYGTFGTKHELFKKALAQYIADRRQGIERPLRSPDASLPAIVAFFKEAPAMMTQGHPGCLVVNTGIELGLRDPEIGDMVKGFFRDLAGVLEECLERAVGKGELKRSTDVAKLAAYLATELRTGLMLARSGHTRREIARHFEVALQVLE